MFRSGQHVPTGFSTFYGLYRQQVAMLILHPNGVKTDMGEDNAPLPVEKDEGPPSWTGFTTPSLIFLQCPN